AAGAPALRRAATAPAARARRARNIGLPTIGRAAGVGDPSYQGIDASVTKSARTRAFSRHLGPVAVERRVAAAPPNQLVVRALFDELAVLEDDDPIGVANGREPMRDDECGPAGEQRPQRLLDLPFGPDVDGRGRLVEDED